MGKIRKPEEAATIDASLIVLTSESTGDAIGITTNTEVATEIQTETTEANKLIIKGILKAQKKEKQTLTGIQLTLTDNMTVLELAKAVQGGEIVYDENGKVLRYTPPIVGEEAAESEKYTVDVYTAVMDSSGEVVKYEKTTYFHCTGQPFAYNAKDDEWRSAQYVLMSLPKKGEPPYDINYVDDLPEVEDASESTPELGTLTVVTAAGSTAGKMKITVTPEKAAGNVYKYKVAANVTAPSYNQDCTSGYTDWDGTSELNGTTGQKLLLVETTTDGKARAAGIGPVTVKA